MCGQEPRDRTLGSRSGRGPNPEPPSPSPASRTQTQNPAHRGGQQPAPTAARAPVRPGCPSQRQPGPGLSRPGFLQAPDPMCPHGDAGTHRGHTRSRTVPGWCQTHRRTRACVGPCDATPMLGTHMRGRRRRPRSCTGRTRHVRAEAASGVGAGGSRRAQRQPRPEASVAGRNLRLRDPHLPQHTREHRPRSPGTGGQRARPEPPFPAPPSPSPPPPVMRFGPTPRASVSSSASPGCGLCGP